MKVEETVDYHIKINWHAMSNLYNSIASKHDLTQTTGFVLLNIDEDNGTPATKIAPLMGMKATSLSRVLKSMDDNGLIERKGDQSDGRLVRITLTDKGIEKKKIAKKVVKDFNLFLLKEIPPKKLSVYFDVMKKVNELTMNYKEEHL